MKQKLVAVTQDRLTAVALIKRVGIMAALAGTLSACELRVGVDYNGKTGVDRQTVTPEFRTGVKSRY